MRYNNLLKYLSFGCVCLIIPVMAVATVLEKIYGTEFAREHIYTSLTMIILWGVASMSAVWYLLRMKLYRKIATFSLHLSLIVILIGALITHLSGKQGKIHLRIGDEPTKEFFATDGNSFQLPFELSLEKFNFEYYPGTFSPSDFISEILIKDGDAEISGSVSMNKIFSYRNYRFYQSGYEDDSRGSFLSVSFDPYGIAVAYTGYIWLLLSISLFFFQKKTILRNILKQLRSKPGLAILFIFLGSLSSFASPSSFPKEVAEEFGTLYIYYNGRIAPINTFAHDFAIKIYGKENYQGLSSEQIIAGWFFFYDEWKNEPFIKIKGEKVKDALGLEESYARLTDFVGPEGFKLDKLLKGSDFESKDILTANEKFNLISTLVTGSVLQIYPFKDNETGSLKWFAVKDKPTEEMPFDQWLFIRSSMDLVAEKIALKDWNSVSQLLRKIKKYQMEEGTELLPSQNKIKTEIYFNRFNYDKPLAMIFLTLGLVLFLIFLSCFISGKYLSKRILYGSLIILILLFIYLSFRLGIRWFISGHLPLSNGFETMQFMAWVTLIAVLFIFPYFRLSLPFGYLICGFTLLVAMMGESSPQITNLMPVLQSPLLSIHVMVIMLAYTLLFLIMLNSFTGLLIGLSNRSIEKTVFLQNISHLMLYPAVFLLVIGIFIGAVWANVSWGRYWGWDPKEVWALITFLIYALPLHSTSLSRFRKPFFFHSYMIFAFLSVVITYFGVNFFLGGMHSYA
ncbi:MAG: cytochrome c biogenesis protein CcsA [Muribaculaceae bacterium]|nr:cytochrome c biogenesis protein CcsA [Muribaculaceae bacterium]